VGGEGSYFSRVTNYVRSADGRLEIPLEHFSSTIWSWWAKNLYAVLDIPGKYLSKGDLLYVLTGATDRQGGDWTPGHAGMYLGVEDAMSGQNDGETIIESTSTNSFFQGAVRFDHLNRQITGFKDLAGSHIYMGARRPSVFEVTDNDRYLAADWAIGQLGMPYALTGGPFLANDTPLWEGLTCVGLTELAYEFGAGKKIVPYQAWRLLLSPLRQFKFTRPVNSAEISVGETITVKVVGVVNTGTFGSDYYTDDTRYTRALDLSASSAEARSAWNESRANFEPVFGQLTFTPNFNDGGKDFRFAVTVDATKSNAGKETAFMTFSVRKPGTHFVRKDPPVVEIFSVSGNLNQTNIVVDGNEVSMVGNSSATRLRMTWDPPPQNLDSGATFPMELRADTGENPEQIRSAFGAPYLAGQINDSVILNENPAFSGYEFIRQDFSSGIYGLVERNLNKNVTVGDRPFVVLEFRAYRTFGAFTSGQVGARVTWDYAPAP